VTRTSKLELLGGVEDDGVINLVSHMACIANFMDLQLWTENGGKQMLGFGALWCDYRLMYRLRRKWRCAIMVVSSRLVEDKQH
jgi:hypothetical protein